MSTLPLLLAAFPLVPAAPSSGQDAPTSEATDECLTCHESFHPGILADWASSRHASVTPEQALEKPLLSRRFSAQDIPEELRSVSVGCYECHGLNTDRHEDSFEHFGYEINVIVSPDDCSVCHPVEAEEYAGSKKANALLNLRNNATFDMLVNTATGIHASSDGRPAQLDASDSTKNETCYACHGSEIEVIGKRTKTILGQEAEFPILSNWPNQGVGRINPDGSKGACTACHPRHGFSLEVARKPYTCSQCHLQPDVPAYEVYMESKHGNLFSSEGHEYEWDSVPWHIGEDYRSPTCATCHNAQVVAPDGTTIAERTHDFGARLWVRILGLPYTHAQPKSGETWRIENADGLPLPTTFAGEPASEFLIDEAEVERRRAQMQKICNACHSSSWSEGHFQQLDQTIEETDEMVRAATELMQRAWDEGWADAANPFDEPIERKWTQQWLFYANSVRYGAAMAGPDYATFKNGWWQLTKNLREMQEWVAAREKK